MNEFFEAAEVTALSPKEQWKQDHGISAVRTMEGYSARAREFGSKVGLGDTEEDALVDLALKLKIADWRTQ